jgi:hypothetical protein
MDMTMFIAQIWGPILFAVGLGIFLNGKYYARIYHDLEKETLGLLTFGVVAMAAGIIQISVHNVWDTVQHAIVSALGWGAFVKGAAFIVAPKFIDRGGDWALNSKLLPLVGSLTLLLGSYLSWVGYFA